MQHEGPGPNQCRLRGLGAIRDAQPALGDRDFRAAKADVVGESDAAHMKEHLYSKLKELGMK